MHGSWFELDECEYDLGLIILTGSRIFSTNDTTIGHLHGFGIMFVGAGTWTGCRHSKSYSIGVSNAFGGKKNTHFDSVANEMELIFFHFVYLISVCWRNRCAGCIYKYETFVPWTSRHPKSHITVNQSFFVFVFLFLSPLKIYSIFND